MAKRGLLLMNLGSPEAPTPKAVKKYLTQFLTDRFVIDLPFLLRQALVRGVIAPFRAHKSAEAYAKIWTENGSPLVHTTRLFAAKVKTRMAPDWDVRWAMRYGEPSIAGALKSWDVSEIYLVPLYPQYAESSTRTALEDALLELRRQKNSTPVRVLEDFYDQPEFIASEVRQIQAQIDRAAPDHLLLSFHGLPGHHLSKLHPENCFQSAACCAAVTSANRYCYRAQAMATTRSIVNALRFPAERVSIGFQSRLGRRPWIQPYTDVVVPELAARGVKRLLVSCPSFVTDCLETLEEVQLRLREQFLAAGGEDLQLIPALNEDDLWVEDFCRMVTKSTVTWKPIRSS